MSASLQLQTFRPRPKLTEFPPRSWETSDDLNLRRCIFKHATMPQMMRALKRSEQPITRRSIALKLDTSYLNTKEA